MNKPIILFLTFLCMVLTENNAFVLFRSDVKSVLPSSRNGVVPTKESESSYDDEQKINPGHKSVNRNEDEDAYYHDRDEKSSRFNRDGRSYNFDYEDFNDENFDETHTRSYDDGFRRSRLRRDRRRVTSTSSPMPQSRPPAKRERKPRKPDKAGNFDCGPPSWDLESDSGQPERRSNLIDDEEENNMYATGKRDEDYYYNDSVEPRGRRYRNDRRGRRSRQRQYDLTDEDWFEVDGNPITDFIDNVFGIDRDEINMKADEYEQLMGRRPSRTRERRPSAVSSSRRKYRDGDSVDSWDEEEQLVEDEIILDQDVALKATDNTDSEVDEENIDDSNGKKLLEMSMEERARRLERVPPDDIPAWGPTGDLGIDIRTKMMMDAMDDLRSIRSKVTEREQKTQLMREDIAVLRTDATIESKKQKNNPTRRSRNILRQILLDIEDTARDLRRAQKLEAIARDELRLLQDKHWAILSLYDVDKASQEISDAFNELSLAESKTDSSGSTEKKN
mmetsp:Transcript_18502/g.27960  ORF Transcript_18502/g.27960 Transcript_18502/m.27960 type:complete len:505 (-) Transcript_18502:1358-2872(-)